uniref:Uncharacterized protein n=1 Tax=Pan troglodytes TaxID=9598 RepID=A0A2I3T7S3_PANTR
MDTDIKRLLVFIPSLFLENSSVLETHLTWLCVCFGFVTAVSLVLYLVVKPNTSSKRSSLSHKVTRFLKSPLIELALETFFFICSYFVYFYYCALLMFVRTKPQSMAKNFQ